MRVINSIGGIGDILFCEPIFRHYWKLDGVKPTVVIHAHMMWIQAYIESATFTSECPDYFATGKMGHGTHHINLRYANQILRGLSPHDHSDLERMMLDKYRLIGLPEDLWKTLDIKFDFRFPQSIAVDLAQELKITPTTKFILINEYSQSGQIEIFVDYDPAKTYWMHIKDGYKMLDWWYMIWSAEENHHVSTSTFFLMQAIKNNFPEWNGPCYIYPRPNHDGLRGISQLNPDFNLIRVDGK